MAILDERSEFADAASVAHAAGTVLLGDVIDTSGDGINDVEGLSFVINVDTGITVASSTGTIQFKLVSDSTASIATDGTATEHFVSASFATSTTAIPAGKTLVNVRLPKGTYERYLGVLYVVGTTTTNAGKVNAFLTPEWPTWKAMPEGDN